MSTVLITGANKGLGYATAQQLIEAGHTVYMGARHSGRGEAAALKSGGRFVQLDVSDTRSVKAAISSIGEREGLIDILINNAGVANADSIGGPEGIDGDIALGDFNTNVVGMIRVIQAALPLLRASDNPVVVNLTSGLGSFWAVTTPGTPQEQAPPFVVYGTTKAAVSMLTVQYARAYPDIKFNAVEPGYTATDLTAALGGGQTPAEGARVVVSVATIGKDGPTGTLQEHDGQLAW
jgi:NAD(P)-dependent dehydrogenase (short-subunit alcohol dehydrogenase family)